MLTSEAREWLENTRSIMLEVLDGTWANPEQRKQLLEAIEEADKQLKA